MPSLAVHQVLWGYTVSMGLYLKVPAWGLKKIVRQNKGAHDFCIHRTHERLIYLAHYVLYLLVAREGFKKLNP